MSSLPPVFYVRVAADDGSAGSRLELTGRVLSLRFEDDESKADRLTLTLENQDLALFDEPSLRSGTLLEAAWGYPGNLCPARTVVVTKLSGNQVLTVEALAKSVLMHSLTRTRTFTDVRRSDVVRRIAQESGFGPELQDVEDTAVVYEAVTQSRMTDAQFLLKLAKAEGYQFYVDHTGLHFHRRRVGQRPLRTLTWRESPVGEIVDFSVESDVAGRPGATTVKGRSPLERKSVEARSSNGAERGRDTLAEELELVSPEDGRSRVVQRIGSEEVRPTAAQDAASAKAEARGRFEAAQQSAVVLRLEVVGEPSYAAKTVLRVEGLGRRLSGNYYAKRVEHSVDTGGYRCSLELRSDGTGGFGDGSPGAESAGRVNRQRGPEGSPDAEGAQLEQLDLVDPETGAVRTVYRDARQGNPPRGTR